MKTARATRQMRANRGASNQEATGATTRELRKADIAAVDRRSPTPLYHQIYLVLRSKILDGSYPSGSSLPGEQEIVKLFGVSRITAKRSLDELAGEGLAVRQQGRGTNVCFRPGAVPVRSNVEGLLENLFSMGLKTQVRLLEFDYEPSTPEVARALRCRPGDPVQRAIRLRSIEGGPFSFLTTFVPEEIGRRFSRKDLASTALLALLERNGIVIGSAEQTISATVADNHVAPLLQVVVGSPLLRISRIVMDSAGRPVEYIIGLYRPDRYQFHMTLERVQGKTQNLWSPAAKPAA